MALPSTLKHWAWDYFFTDPLKFKANNYHKNAWCLGCLNYHRNLLRESDILAVTFTGVDRQIRTDAEREIQGS